MTPTEALSFHRALAMEYIQIHLSGRKATQMALLAKLQEAEQALAAAIVPRTGGVASTQPVVDSAPEADKDAGNDADSG